MAPPMSGYYKDHKAPAADGREHLGPKLRAVCGAVESSNGPLSYILSEILSYLMALCLSTEEMCGALDTFNTMVSTTRSPFMDVVGMYPNLQHEGVARTCREEFLRSDLVIEEVDTKAPGIYIAILYQDRKL